MKARKIVKNILLVFAVVFLLGGILMAVYASVFDPYRDTARKFESVADITSLLTKEQAIKDIDFMMKRIKERHPAAVKALPQEMTAQYEKELALFGEEVPVLDVWRSASRIAAKMHDGHTNIWYIAQGLALPLQFEMRSGRIYCVTDEYMNYEVSAINGIPVLILYNTFLDQFSYEIESFAQMQFASVLPSDVYLAFMGAVAFEDIQSRTGVDITFNIEGTEQTVAFMFEQPAAAQVYDTPFVSYEIDTNNSVGIFTLRQCNYNDVYRQTLKNFFTEVKENNIQSVAVDLRDNGGGNSLVANEFIKYLAVPEYYGYGGVKVRLGPYIHVYEKKLQPNEQYVDLLFDGDLYALTSTNTFSSATDFAVMICDNKLGTVIGEISGNMPASYGDVLGFTLPSSRMRLQVSFKYFGRIDETKKDLPLIPDYQVKKEEVLDTLYEVIKK